jgi:hypothetical protein
VREGAAKVQDGAKVREGAGRWKCERVREGAVKVRECEKVLRECQKVP